jgi:DNA sulfur modification protein DndC
MEAMVDSGEEWLEPLLDVRDFLAETQDPKRKVEVRQHVRRNGQTMRKNYGDPADPLVRGPYTLEFCQEVLRRLLRAEHASRASAPAGQEITLINENELLEIRRIWRYERHDWQDSLPRIFEEETGETLDIPEDDQAGLDGNDEALLAELTAKHDLPLGLVKGLIGAERDLQGLQRRSRIMDKLGAVLTQEWRSEADVIAEIVREEANA